MKLTIEDLEEIKDYIKWKEDRSKGIHLPFSTGELHTIINVYFNDVDYKDLTYEYSPIMSFDKIHLIELMEYICKEYRKKETKVVSDLESSI